MWSHRADIAHVLGQDDVGPRFCEGRVIQSVQRLSRRCERLDLTVDTGAVRALGIDRRLHQHRNAADGRRIVALMTDAHEGVGQAQCCDDLGRARHKRADSHVSVPLCGRP